MACDTTKRIDFSLKKRYNIAEVMIMADDTTKKRRGRPPLSDEERELRRLETNKKQAERLKRNGYAAQKRYRERNKEKTLEQQRLRSKRYKQSRYYVKIGIPAENKPLLLKLAEDNGLSIEKLIITALKKQYGVDLHSSVDNSERK